MGSIEYFADIFLHFDTHFSAITSEYSLLVYLLLFTVVFCEIGLVITPFLPGVFNVFNIIFISIYTMLIIICRSPSLLKGKILNN
jgi:hypothetical protein